MAPAAAAPPRRAGTYAPGRGRIRAVPVGLRPRRRPRGRQPVPGAERAVGFGVMADACDLDGVRPGSGVGGVGLGGEPGPELQADAVEYPVDGVECGIEAAVFYVEHELGGAARSGGQLGRADAQSGPGGAD